MTNVMGGPAQTTYVLRRRVECMDDESRGEEFRQRGSLQLSRNHSIEGDL